MLHEITIFPGKNKNGVKENFDQISLKPGEIISIVGPTGSGKTAFINDIELLAQEDTATGRVIHVNNAIPEEGLRYNPSQKPIIMITQNTKCFADLPVSEFLQIHAQARNIQDPNIIETTVTLANKFTGEKISADMKVTTLSGGQTRSLMIADAITIGASPVILLDEVENAGIFKHEVVNLIRQSGKIIIFVTHDPVIALLTNKRIIMEGGGVKTILTQDDNELPAVDTLIELDKRLSNVREHLREGKYITNNLLGVRFYENTHSTSI